jgi:ATPase family associated with various cellular activities (AAA)
MIISTSDNWWDVGVQNPYGRTLFDIAQTNFCIIAGAGGPAARTVRHDTLPDGRRIGLKNAGKARELAIELASKFVLNIAHQEHANSLCVRYCLTSREGVLDIQRTPTECEVRSVFTNFELQDRIDAFLKTKLTPEIVTGRVYIAVETNLGLTFKSLGIGGQPIERGNYSQTVLSEYDRIVRDLNSKSPAGRVSVLSGKPGTGKSYLVRGLLNDAAGSNCIILPPQLVTQLSGPSFLPALASFSDENPGKSMVFFIEDADECLATRMGDNIGSISALLNLGDGIIGQLLDVRIVATTNAAHQDIDEAILRPGRLSASIQVGALSYDEAVGVYSRLRPGAELTPRKSYTLAEVYQLARADGWVAPPKATAIGFSNAPGA